MLGRFLPARGLVALGMLAAAGVATFVPASAAAADMDCSDFATQAEAQDFFLAAGEGDPHRLDGDADGIACESNPCPCSTTPAPFTGEATETPTSSPTADTDPDGSGNSGPVRRERAKVIKVSDGDTLKVRLRSGAVRSVRLLGIDTPEVYGTRECGGGQASRAMARLAPVGARVRLVSDPSQANADRYQRLLRYVVRKGRDVGKAQIAKGLAQVYVYRDDPFRRTRAYQRVERRAKSQARGSWSTCWR